MTQRKSTMLQDHLFAKEALNSKVYESPHDVRCAAGKSLLKQSGARAVK